MLDSFVLSLQLKSEIRSGWALRGVRSPESVADHSLGTAYLCLLYAGEAGVERARAVEMALVHDIAEAVTGDVATRVASMNDATVADEKRRRESEAVDQLLAEGGQGGNLVRALWEEYEESVTPTALFVRDMNLIDMCAQALVYEAGTHYDVETPSPNFPQFEGMDEFFATTRPRISTAVGLRLFGEITERYNGLQSVRGRGGLRLESERA